MENAENTTLVFLTLCDCFRPIATVRQDNMETFTDIIIIH